MTKRNLVVAILTLVLVLVVSLTASAKCVVYDDTDKILFPGTVDTLLAEMEKGHNNYIVTNNIEDIAKVKKLCKERKLEYQISPQANLNWNLLRKKLGEEIYVVKVGTSEKAVAYAEKTVTSEKKATVGDCSINSCKFNKNEIIASVFILFPMLSIIWVYCFMHFVKFINKCIKKVKKATR